MKNVRWKMKNKKWIKVNENGSGKIDILKMIKTLYIKVGIMYFPKYELPHKPHQFQPNICIQC